MKMKDDDDAKGFDGVRGGSGICSVGIVGSKVDEICRIGFGGPADNSDKSHIEPQEGSEEMCVGESCDVGKSCDVQRGGIMSNAGSD